VPHVLEPAPSARAKCRGCARPIGKGELRFGERIANPFAEGETTLWFHPACAACKRPEPLLEALAAADAPAVPDREQLERTARDGIAHARLPRIDGAERAPSGRAACRHCKQPIERGAWRIRLVFFQDGRFEPGGCVHLACRAAYFETDDVLARLLLFSPGLDDAWRAELADACAGEPPPGA
jgi:hypothetical protein